MVHRKFRVSKTSCLRRCVTKGPNIAVEQTAQKLRFWVPSALRATAAAHLKRYAATFYQTQKLYLLVLRFSLRQN